MTLATTADAARASRIVLAASATGARHAMTTDGRDVTGRAVCGTDTALPLAAGITELSALEAVILLNDHHLDGGRVCQTCRTILTLAATA